MGRPCFARWASSPAFQWPPLRRARLRCERESVYVVCPPVLPIVSSRRGRWGCDPSGWTSTATSVRSRSLEPGGGPLAGRVRGPRRRTLELFAASLARDDRVALEVTGNAWEIARILEAHVGAGGRGQPERHRDRARRARRPIASTLARWPSCWRSGALDAVWMPDERTRCVRRRLARRAPAGPGALARQERDPRGADAPPQRPPAGQRPVRRQGPAWLPASSCRSRSRRPSTPACARSTSSTTRSRGRARDRAERCNGRSCGG